MPSLHFENQQMKFLNLQCQFHINVRLTAINSSGQVNRQDDRNACNTDCRVVSLLSYEP